MTDLAGVPGGTAESRPFTRPATYPRGSGGALPPIDAAAPARSLRTEVRLWLTEHPEGASAALIALAVRARLSAVLDVLRSDAAYVVHEEGKTPNLRKIWTLAQAPGESLEGQRPRRKPSQGDLILVCLSDGRWWSSAELHRRVFCVLHSRVSELRSRGHVIEHRGGGAGTAKHFYRLVPLVNQRKAA